MAKSKRRTIQYDEGGIEGMMLVSNDKKNSKDTFRVKLEKMRKPPMNKISSPEDAVRTVRDMEDYDREHVKILHLDVKNRVTGIEQTSMGGLDFAVVHPRETIKGALLNNSASVMFIHNHPSGDCSHSKEDKEVYEKLKKAFSAVDISLIDGIVIGKECYYSFVGDTKKKLNGIKRKRHVTQTSLGVGERRKRKKLKSRRR